MEYKKDRKYIIIPGKDQSIDTVAGVIAYQELLKKLGYDSGYYIGEKLSEQVNRIIREFHIKVNNEEYIDNKNTRFILIGTPDENRSLEFIDRKKIDRIVSNRENGEMQFYSMASAVASQFKNEQTDISKESAVLLFFGILDKTVNMKDVVARKNDALMMEWLERRISGITSLDMLKRMYRKEKYINILKNEISSNTIKFSYKGKVIGITKVNCFDVKVNILKQQKDIIALIKGQKFILNLNYLIVMLNDFEEGLTYIITDEDICKELIVQSIHVVFDNYITRYTRIISRAELMKRIGRLDEFKKNINQLTAEKCDFLTNTYWWVDVCIKSMKDADIDALEKNGFYVPDSKDWTKDKKMKKDKDKISEILKNAIHKDLYYTAFIYLVTIMEDYLCQIIRLVLEKDHRRILINIRGINCKNEYELKDILNPESNFIKDIIEDRVVSIMYANPKCQTEYFQRALGIEFENAEQWYEIKATRDVIVHNSGIINEIYLLKSNEKARGKIGEKILISEAYFRESIAFLRRSIVKISLQLKRSFKEQ